jgi:2-dehydro-3-deoxyphosphogluconate aldolase/(4S)-4-hydroxy-2-oxoglutarate aldolase
MLNFEFSHVVVNCENSEQAEQYSGKIESLFGMRKKDEGISVANAGALHFMKNKSYGRNGQIAVSTNFMDRAVFYLKKAKQDLIEESARYGKNGELVSIYLDTMIGGFAFKLVKKN